MLSINIQDLPKTSKLKKIVHYFGELYTFCAFKKYFNNTYFDTDNGDPIDDLFFDVLEYQFGEKTINKVMHCIRQDSYTMPGGSCSGYLCLKDCTRLFVCNHKFFILNKVCNEPKSIDKQVCFFNMVDMEPNPEDKACNFTSSICYLIRSAKMIKHHNPNESFGMNWNKANQLYKGMEDHKKEIQVQKQKEYDKKEKQIKQKMADQRKIAKQEAIKARESNKLAKEKVNTKHKQEQHKLKEQLKNKPLWYKTSVLITNKVKNFM